MAGRTIHPDPVAQSTGCTSRATITRGRIARLTFVAQPLGSHNIQFHQVKYIHDVRDLQKVKGQATEMMTYIGMWNGSCKVRMCI